MRMDMMAKGRMQIICYLDTDCDEVRDRLRNGRDGKQEEEGQKPLHNSYACLLFHL